MDDAQEKQARYAAAWEEYRAARLATIERVVATGQTAYLHRADYVPVDSIVNKDKIGSFDFEFAMDAGLEGWTIVAVIPRTTGVALSNFSLGSTMGATWGGGMGGNVAGVYVVMSQTITAESLEISRPAIEDWIRLSFSRSAIARALSA